MRRVLTVIVCLVSIGSPAMLAGPATARSFVPAGADSCPAVARHEDARHSGFSCTTLPTTLTLKWTATLNGATSYPLIAGGKVFVTTSNAGGSYGGWLYALDAADGTVAWGPVPLSGTYYYFTLAYDAGRVFVNDFDGTVRAYDAGTGAQLWARATAYFNGEPVASHGMVWVHGSASVFGLSAATGEILVTSPYLDGSGSAPAVDGGGVYVSTGCESQYRLRLDGTIAWVVNNGCSGGGGSSAASWRKKMYGSDGFAVLRKDTGEQVGSFAGVPAFAGRTGFFAVENSVYAEDVRSGIPLWTTFLTYTVLAGPVVTPDGVYVATSRPAVEVLDPRSGALLSTIALPAQPGGGGQYSACPSDMAAGESLLVVPTGATVNAFG
jgi:outer membrane protein assembly factor BamB